MFRQKENKILSGSTVELWFKPLSAAFEFCYAYPGSVVDSMSERHARNQV